MPRCKDEEGALYPTPLTLRFTYGEIKGYKPRNAVSRTINFAQWGIEKDTGVYRRRAGGLKELAKKKDLWLLC